jgi:hypothetical protein
MYMKWSIVTARKHLAELLRKSVEEPQAIYNRDRLVGAVVDPDTFAEFEAWRAKQGRTSLGRAFGEFRKMCDEEGYELEVPERQNRENAFVQSLDELPEQ